MVYFNNIAKHQPSDQALNLEEEQMVVSIINRLILTAGVSPSEEQLIQSFIDEFQSLAHFKDSNIGALCTDDPTKTSGEDQFYELIE